MGVAVVGSVRGVRDMVVAVGGGSGGVGRRAGRRCEVGRGGIYGGFGCR